jgi:hypothetical protein
MKHHSISRLAPAIVAVLVLAACGTDNDAASRPLGTAAPSGASGLRAPTPITMSGSSRDDATAAAEAAPAADSDMIGGDRMIAPWIVDYVIGDGMPALPTDDTGYVFDATAEVTGEQVASVAAALGVAGDPVRIEDEYNVMWRVGPDDGSAPSIWVYDDGQQSWNYNGPWADGAAREGCAVAVDSDGNQSGECPEPEPPVGVPSVDEAEGRVRDYLTALGQDVTNLKFESYGDEWFASVDVSDGTDERAAVRTWSFGFGAEGALQYASGSLGLAEAVGPYQLVDLQTAVDRLSEGFYGGYGGYAGVAVMESDVGAGSDVVPAGVPTDPAEAPSVDTPAATPADNPAGKPTEAPVSDEPVSDEPVLVDPMPVDPPVGEPMPSEPVVVTLVDVQADLWWVWDDDGSAWLLPAYRFIDTDGGWHVVPAVTDEFLIQATPVTIEESPPVDLPLPAPAPEGSATGGGTDPGTDPGADPEASMTILQDYVGLTIDEFSAEAKASGFSTRIVQQDGEFLAATDDYRTDRVNVAVEGDLVVSIESIG